MNASRSTVLAGLALLFLNCDSLLPQYRITVQNVPAGTTELLVAAYVQGALAMQTPTVDVSGPLDSVTLGLDLGPDLQGDATISIAAERADGCLLAVGTSGMSSPSATATDVTISLAAPDPPVTDSVCTKTPPVILAAIRSQDGPLSRIQFAMAVQGWGFPADANVSVSSTQQVLCVTGNECTSACTGTCTGTGMGMGMGMGGMGDSISGSCLTDCSITADVVHAGPGLIQLSFDPAKNILQQGEFGSGGGAGSGTGTFVQSIDLLGLISAPLTITLKSTDGQTTLATFTETGMAMSGGV